MRGSSKNIVPPLAAAERKELEWESPEIRTLVTVEAFADSEEAEPGVVEMRRFKWI